MSVARNSANGIGKEREMHNSRQGDKGLQVLPLADVVVVQVQELQIAQTTKYTCRWKLL